MDNRNLSPEKLLVLRKKAVNAVISLKFTQKEASRIFGFSPTSMCKYIKEYKEKGELSLEYRKRGLKNGARSKLNETQLKQMVSDILNHTPDELGMDYTLWNSRVIKEYILKKYSVNYNDRSVRKMMTRLGFTSQTPIRKAYQQDPKKVEIWTKETYPLIKEKAIKEKARIYWGDEMGIDSSDNNGKVYGLKGKKPVTKKSGSKFKCNTLSAISAEGFMNWMVFTDKFNACKFINFISRIIRQIKSKIFLIVDNHGVHHSHKVKKYVEKHKDKIELFFLPPYSPEINPLELVNHDVKANANNFRPLTSLENLTINVRCYLTKIQFNKFKIIQYFKKNEVSYAAW